MLLETEGETGFLCFSLSSSAAAALFHNNSQILGEQLGLISLSCLTVQTHCATARGSRRPANSCSWAPHTPGATALLSSFQHLKTNCLFCQTSNFCCCEQGGRLNSRRRIEKCKDSISSERSLTGELLTV